MYKVIVSIVVWLTGVSAHASELVVRHANKVFTFNVSDGLEGTQSIELNNREELIDLLKSETLLDVRNVDSNTAAAGGFTIDSSIAAGSWTETGK